MEQQGKHNVRSAFSLRFRAHYAYLLSYVVLSAVWFVITATILQYFDTNVGENAALHMAEDALIVGLGFVLFLATARELTRRMEEHFAQNAASQLAAIVDNSDDAIISRGLDLRIRSWNPAAERLFGYTAAEAIGQDISIIIPPEHRGEVARNRELLAEGRLLKTYDTVRLTKDGRRVHVSLTLSPLKNEAGRITGNSLIVRDITERKRGEQRIERLGRFYAALSETNEAIMRMKDRQQLFDRVCTIAVEQAGLALAWVGIVELGGPSVRVVATAGKETGYVEGARSRIERSLVTGSGPTATAIRENQPQILNYYGDETTAPWRRHAEAHDIHSSVVIPLTDGGKPIGCLNLYAREHGFFDDELVQLLREIAENLSFALDNFVREDQRQIAEQQVRESEARYRLLIQHFPEGVVLLFDRDMRFQIADGKGFAQLGIDPLTCIGKLLREAMPADLCNAVEPYCRRALTGRAGELELSACGRYWSIQVLPVHEEAGEIVGGLTVAQDLTEKRLAEEQLRLAGTAFENIADAVTITDATPRILYVNKAFTAITGYALEEVAGQNPRMLQSGRHDESFYQTMWKTLAATGCWQGEMWDRRKSGEAYPALLRINAVKNSAGAVTNYVAVFNDISQHKQHEARLEYLAHYDLLTGLPNRSLLGDRIEVAVAQARRHGTRLAVLFLDLDRFKVVNDSLGHAVGDKLLKAVADRLLRCMRASDTVSRHGGDEFLILLPEISHVEDAGRVAEKIMAEMTRPLLIEQHKLATSVSIGIAIFPDNGEDMAQLLRNADAAMYSAKQSGRNRFQFYSQHMNARATERLHLEHDLRYAVERNELSLVYQPQVAVASRRLVGIEALLRWIHPSLGTIPPDRFIPVAEEGGLILGIGEWVLREACKQRKKWHALPDTVPISVNVSAIQFRQVGFANMVADILQETGLPAKALELEVTESVVMHGAQDVIQKLSDLNHQGLTVAIDDFGTGYSSLSYLRNLPIHRLKIDRSFISDLPTNKDAAAITRAIVNMGRTLGLDIMAEGVETEAQAQFLQSAACEEAQGYLYCRPLHAANLEKWLEQHVDTVHDATRVVPSRAV